MIDTTLYGLHKPEDTDSADLRIFVGQNMDLIETALSGLDSAMLTSVSWLEIGDLPTEFPPSTHQHDWNDITGEPAFDNYQGWDLIVGATTDRITSLATLTLIGAGTTSIDYDSALNVVTINSTPTDNFYLSGISGSANGTATFTRSGLTDLTWNTTHTHSWLTDITDIPTAFTPATHSHLWTDISNPPATYDPSPHNHIITDITDLESSLASKYSTSGGEITGSVTITNQGDLFTLLKLNSERSWSFKQKGIGTGSELILASDNNSKTFRITSPLNIDSLEVRIENDGTGFINSPLIKEGGVSLTTKYASKTHGHLITEITDLESTLTGKYSTTGGEITGSITITNQGDMVDLIKFNTHRPWMFKQKGIDSNAELLLVPDTNSKRFRISSPLGIDALEIRVHDTIDSAYIDSPNIKERGIPLIQKYVQIEATGGTGTVSKLWTGTQAQYDLLTKDPNTVYYIVG
jgi:hypothetical protein